MSNWITWDELKSRWNLVDFEIIDLFQQGLRPYSKNTGNLYDYPQEYHFGYHAKMRISELDDQIERLTKELGKSSTEVSKLQYERSIHEKKLEELIKEDPYCSSWEHFTFGRNEEKAKRLISEFKDLIIFKLKNVENFETEYRNKVNAANQKAFPCMPGTKWEDVKITLISETTVTIETPLGSGTFTYHDLKMADLRTRERKPHMLWELLKIFAQYQGYLTPSSAEYDSKLPDTAKRLNKHLQVLFNIPESIFTSHYKSTDRNKPEKDRNKPAKGYRTRIFFSDQTQVIQ
jgi:hypothetical protein